MEPFNLLSYGAIGLSCILSILAFELLRKEQDKKTPRNAILHSIYIFMGMAITSSLLGYYFEDKRIQIEYNGIKDKCEHVKTAIEKMVDSKTGNLKVMKTTSSGESNKQLIQNMQDIDKSIKDLLKEFDTKVKSSGK